MQHADIVADGSFKITPVGVVIAEKCRLSKTTSMSGVDT